MAKRERDRRTPTSVPDSVGLHRVEPLTLLPAGLDADAAAEWLISASRELGPDRLPDVAPARATHTWLYADADFELAALQALVAEGFEANRHVDYALNYAKVGASARFRRAVDSERDVTFWSAGATTVMVDGRVAAKFPAAAPVGATSIDSGVPHFADVPHVIGIPEGSRFLELLVDAGSGLPAIVSTPVESRGARWQFADAEGDWLDVQLRPGEMTPPHLAHENLVSLDAVEVEPGVFVLPAAVLGRVVITAAQAPHISVGESLAEALSGDGNHESRFDLVNSGPGEWTTRHRLGFRYVVVRAEPDPAHEQERPQSLPVSVAVLANVRSAPARGSFVSDDPVLNQIWATSAYTLRLCMQVFMLDGIKRDRMPWIGDYALSVLSNAYAFADGELVRNGLSALGRPRHGYVNGIADYSLWWLISQGLYQRYFGDRAYLEREADTIDSFLTTLTGYAGDDDVFRPRDEPDSFPEAGPGSVFIDWGVAVEGGRDSTALQMLWFWAVSSAATVLHSVGHPGAPGWQERADRIRATIHAQAWDAETGAWREYLDGHSAAGTYANFLAVQSGISAASTEGMREAIRTAGVGTPFMRSFALRSLAAAGEPEAAVAEIRHAWGAMLSTGSTTFWEEFGTPGEDPYEMYGRPFGKSLCHAWAAGPAALLPEIVLGVRPLSNGWATFAVEPHLGALGWASAVVPVPQGRIVISATGEGDVEVDVPDGCTLVLPDQSHTGPQRVRWNVRESQ